MYFRPTKSLTHNIEPCKNFREIHRQAFVNTLQYFTRLLGFDAHSELKHGKNAQNKHNRRPFWPPIVFFSVSFALVA